VKLLSQTINHLQTLSSQVPGRIGTNRLTTLDQLAHWISHQPTTSPTNVIIICTHNSRRSHLGQIWLQAAAWHCNLEHVQTWSGGTKGTAFYPSAVNALRRQGVDIIASDDSANPIYRVQLQTDQSPFETMSTRYSHPMNPQHGFAAVMVCEEANEACPVVEGAAARFGLPYIDPKVSDGTPEESQVYQQRSLEIGAEMFYAMMKARELRASFQSTK
jgi:arsenate reductase